MNPARNSGKRSAKLIYLVRFAREVLAIMQEEREWNADTLERIHAAARAHGLASLDAEGYFRSEA